MNCPHCRTPLAADARFCPACGKALSPTESGSSWPNATGSAPDLVGREIAGRYRILQKLGEGGMGAVYRGEQISLKRAVAVKLLKPELGSHQLVLRRFNAEAEAVAKLSHPNTVNIYDFGQDSDGSLFIAMEFIEGRSLREAIQTEGPFSPTRAVSIALQVAASLSDAHAHSIVHRDLKPDNVMLQDRGRQKDVVRVLDFGIAKLRDDNRATQQAMTQAGDMLGTPQYMAPEQIRGEAIDGRTDIYALGCMIYEMITARLPFEANTIMAMLSKHLTEQPAPPSARRPELRLPPALDALVLRAMAKDVAARPATMEDFGEQLQALLATLPADPNRSAGMSVQQAAQPSVQQAAVASSHGPIAGAAPTPAPYGTPGAAAFTPQGSAGAAAFTPQGSAGAAAFTPSSPPPITPPGSPPGFAPSSPPPGFAPPSPPPAFGTPPPPGALGHATPPRPAPAQTPAIVERGATSAKSNTVLLVVLLTIAVTGAGVGLYFAMRKPEPAAQQQLAPQEPAAQPGSDEEGSDSEAQPNQPDPWQQEQQQQQPAPSNGPDPWK